LHVDGYTQERGPDAEHRYNSHVIVNDAGDIAAVYRKIHLFDLDLPDGPEPVKLMESDATAPGTEVVACDSVAGCLGVTVCYDLRFPELYQVG
jgi:predicted amidohydrolase